MKKHLLFFLLFLLIGSQAVGQAQQFCATPPERPAWLIQYQQNPDAYPKSNELLFVPMTIHLVGNDQGFGQPSLMDVYRSFCTLNEDFAPANIQFYVAGVNSISNSDLYEHNSSWQALQIMETQNVPNTVNSYLVENAAGACGYAWLSSDNGIVLAKNCVSPNSHTWAHEVGHFLSLPHTFSGWEGYDHDYNLPAPETVNGHPVEKLDGSNCQFSGDGFCDTQADYINGRWACDSNFLSNTVQLDPDSIAFQSDGTFFMSYSLDGCMNRFSDEQIAAMRANLFDRSYLIDPLATFGPMPDEEHQLAGPIENEIVPFYNNVTLEWPAVPNADRYIVQINPLPAFTYIFHQYETTGNSITVYDLSPNKTYYWRIRPLNPYDVCNFNYSEREKFRTGDVASSVQEIPSVTKWKVFPNPVTGHETVRVELTSSQTFDASLTLFDLTGRALQNEMLLIIPGRNELSLPLAGIPAGMYQIRLEGQGGAFVDKIIVTR
jgi:hypothetical protein